jgi:Ser/Thr protein kinase RdoA (MazF antagonist)
MRMSEATREPLREGPAAHALAAAREGRFEDAAAVLRKLVFEEFGLQCVSLEISRDGYSLNSVNGFLRTTDDEEYFFKFHQEEGEEHTLQEFYQAELLKTAGYPVDSPVHVSRALGRQILLYRRRSTPRFADVCRELDGATEGFASATAAQAVLDDLTCAIYRRSLHRTSAAEVAREPIHQLFHTRLVDREGAGGLGGRARRFFFGEGFELAGTRLTAEQLRAARWVVNGVAYRQTLGELLEESLWRLAPERFGEGGAVVAHGDAHNANVWWEGRSGAARLVLFDPAFAGSHVPVLLAEVKATFHNILAHPLWLYHADDAASRYEAAAKYVDGTLTVTTDWRLSPLRQAFLDIKATRLWRPLLREIADHGLLAEDWRRVLRLALFCCPTLVMDLRAGGSGRHNPISSTIGLAVAVAAGSEPEADGRDVISAFLDAIDPAR